jgi:site-specific DNA-adenine methylase
LLARPGGAPESADEIINDLDGFITNFYRAAKFAPSKLAERLNWTVSELDLHARRDWLKSFKNSGKLSSNLRDDPEYFNIKVASWWCWGASAWIGANWPMDDKQSIPDLRSVGGRGVFSSVENIKELIFKISVRLRKTKIICGDWSRAVCSNTALHASRSADNPTAVFLDPPYSNESGSSRVYSEDSNTVEDDVEQWCDDRGEEKSLHIILCGYEGAYDLPGWRVFGWETNGGMSNRSGSTSENKTRERVWINPTLARKIEEGTVENE